YLNWRFVWGRSDCFALIRCYFLGVLGIDIGDFRRPSSDGFPTIGWLTPWKAEKHSFVQMPAGTPVRKHDIIQIALKGGREPNHIGVIVNAERMQMLHNVSAEYTSQVGLYGSYWQTRTTHIFRHESLI
ncbi:MAG: C40 family peptidase, partial [Symploca sp. SIO2G7]|nr:C40 family peptidase [Symploca sp. SIO2G7]